MTAAPALPTDDRPLVVTRDLWLRDEIARLAAASGAAPRPVVDPGEALGRWSAAPAVLLGEDLLAEVAALGPERRDSVYVVARDPAVAPVGPTEGSQLDWSEDATSWGDTRAGGRGSLYRDALAVGAEEVTTLPEGQTWLVQMLTDLADESAVSGTGRGIVVGVIGGSGGAGATTLACALGQSATPYGPAVVVDCDPGGPGVDRILGVEEIDGFRWDALEQTSGRLSSKALRDALPRRNGVGALSWRTGSVGPLAPVMVREALSAARRGHRIVVVDLPRSGDDVVDEVLARCDRVVLVVRPTVAGVSSALRVRTRLGECDVGVVVRGRGAGTSGIGDVVGAPVLCEMGEQRGIDECVDLGMGPIRSGRGPLARACREMLTGAGARPWIR